MADLLYKRTGTTCVDSEGATGKRGTLALADKSWHTVERADGYKWLRPGTYQCEMAYRTSSSGKKSKAIRVLGSYSAGRIYIHSANWPHQLKGCIAPGTTKLSGGVGNSRNAIKSIFNALGGFAVGKAVTLQVGE